VLLIERAIVVEDTQPPEAIYRDPDDDEFLSYAVTGKIKHFVSGDKALCSVSGYRGVNVLAPRAFVDRYLKIA
jgi:predicted nucleic acid-binding protein